MVLVVGCAEQLQLGLSHKEALFCVKAVVQTNLLVWSLLFWKELFEKISEKDKESNRCCL